MAEFFINGHKAKMLAESGYIYEKHNKRKVDGSQVLNFAIETL